MDSPWTHYEQCLVRVLSVYSYTGCCPILIYLTNLSDTRKGLQIILFYWYYFTNGLIRVSLCKLTENIDVAGILLINAGTCCFLFKI